MNTSVQLPAHIQTLLLDLDGTLLDLAFDTRFWLEIVPCYYGSKHGLSAEDALENEIKPRLRAAEGTLNWYCLDHWSRALEMDLSALKTAHNDGVAWLPGAQDFLRRQRAVGRRLVLATNSHPETLRIKDERVGIRPFLDAMHSSHAFGAPKEHAQFWPRFRSAEPFDPERTAFIDDNLAVLKAARAAGIAYVIAVTNPDSSRPPREAPEGFLAVSAVAQIV
jgi:putative hydrolase of the HAD superfamily